MTVYGKGQGFCTLKPKPLNPKPLNLKPQVCRSKTWRRIGVQRSSGKLAPFTAGENGSAGVKSLEHAAKQARSRRDRSENATKES